MKFAANYSVCLLGIDSYKIKIETHITGGMNIFNIIGMVSKSITESKDRIRSALISSNIDFPLGKIIINLSPADMEKNGTAFDLPITLSILIACGYIQDLQNIITVGELSLNGDLIAVKGLLSIALFCKQHNYQLICPYDRVDYILHILPKENIICAKNLKDLIAILNKKKKIIFPTINNQANIYKNTITNTEPNTTKLNLIKIPKYLYRLLLIINIGKHNCLITGAPGLGKSIFVQHIYNCSPDLSMENNIKIHNIYDIAGITFPQNFRPSFRSPHSSSSITAIFGGGSSNIKIGELSLSHLGILFLDELNNFPTAVLNNLLTPMENKNIIISRNKYKVNLPCNFQFITALNPCMCGMLMENNCKCRKSYFHKIPNALLDRIDICIIIHQNIQYNTQDYQSIDYQGTRNQIVKLHHLQLKRQQQFNYENSIDITSQYISTEAMELFLQYKNKYLYSLRIMKNILNVALSIMDLEEKQQITKAHIAEAIFYNISHLKY